MRKVWRMSCRGRNENWLSGVGRAVKLTLSGHTLWLVVLVWYLMVPKVTRNPQGIYQAALDAPLSEWKRQGQYNSLSGCNKAKETFAQATDSKARLKDRNSVADELGAYAAQCVTPDDPRFKSK